MLNVSAIEAWLSFFITFVDCEDSLVGPLSFCELVGLDELCSFVGDLGWFEVDPSGPKEGDFDGDACANVDSESTGRGDGAVVGNGLAVVDDNKSRDDDGFDDDDDDGADLDVA